MTTSRHLLVAALFSATFLGAASHASMILGTGNGALIGGDITDPENDLNDNTGDLNTGTNSSGANFNWISSSASSENYFGDPTTGGGRQAALDLFDNKVGSDTNSKWCCTGTSGGPVFVTLEFAQPYVLTHFTIASGGDAAWRRPSDWRISGSNDGNTFTPIFTHTGSDVWSANNQVIKFESDTENPGSPDFSTPAAFSFFKFEATNTIGGSGRTPGQEFQLEEIEYFGFAVPEPSVLGLALLGMGLIGVSRRLTR